MIQTSIGAPLGMWRGRPVFPSYYRWRVRERDGESESCSEINLGGPTNDFAQQNATLSHPSLKSVALSDDEITATFATTRACLLWP